MKYLLISIICLSVTVPFLSTNDKEVETIYEEYHEFMLNNFDLAYEGMANNDELKLILQEAFPNILDEVLTVHLYKNIVNDKFKYVYKMDGLIDGKAAAAAVNVNKDAYEKLTFEGSCPNSRPCLGECETCVCVPETQIGIICGCFDETSGRCNIF